MYNEITQKHFIGDLFATPQYFSQQP